MIVIASGSRAAVRAEESPRPGSPQRARRRGFTLIETALTTIIVGVGVLSIVAAQQAFHQKNTVSSLATIAMQLGNEIREMTFNLPRHDPVTAIEYWGPEPNEAWVGVFDDIDDFDGSTGAGMIFSAADGNGPLNARRQVIPNMVGWAQVIRVWSVDPFDITSHPDDAGNLPPADGSTSMLKVEVLVTYQGPQDASPEEITRVSWICPN